MWLLMRVPNSNVGARVQVVATIHRTPNWLTRENSASPLFRDIHVVGCAVRYLLILVSIAAACRRSEPQPREHVSAGSAAMMTGSAGSAAPHKAEPKYRTDASTPHTDPKVAGTGKTSMVAAE